MGVVASTLGGGGKEKEGAVREYAGSRLEFVYGARDRSRGVNGESCGLNRNDDVV